MNKERESDLLSVHARTHARTHSHTHTRTHTHTHRFEKSIMIHYYKDVYEYVLGVFFSKLSATARLKKNELFWLYLLYSMYIRTCMCA